MQKGEENHPNQGKQATHIITKGMHMVCASVMGMISENERQSAYQKAYTSMAYA